MGIVNGRDGRNFEKVESTGLTTHSCGWQERDRRVRDDARLHIGIIVLPWKENKVWSLGDMEFSLEYVEARVLARS